MKPIKKITIGLVIIASGLALWSVSNAASRFGPASCTSCQLGLPNPDASTKVFLTTFARQIGMPNGLSSGYPVMVGDVIIVCNSSGCVDYQKTYTNEYEGTNYREQTTNPPGGGGTGDSPGGGGSGGGGGGGPIGGCYGKCNGEVTVGA